jgi:hypothetical protein
MKNILAAFALIGAFLAEHSAFAICVNVDHRQNLSASEIDRWTLASIGYSGQCALLLFGANTHPGAYSYV